MDQTEETMIWSTAMSSDRKYPSSVIIEIGDVLTWGSWKRLGRMSKAGEKGRSWRECPIGWMEEDWERRELDRLSFLSGGKGGSISSSCICILYTFSTWNTWTKMKEQMAFPASSLNIRGQTRKQPRNNKASLELFFVCLAHDAWAEGFGDTTLETL